MRLCLFFVCLSQVFGQKEVQTYTLTCDIKASTYKKLDIRESFGQVTDQLKIKVYPRCGKKFAIEIHEQMSDWKELVEEIINSDRQISVFEALFLISNNPEICSQKTILAFEKGGKAMVCDSKGSKIIVEGINFATQEKNQKKKTSKPLRFLVHSKTTRPKAPSRPPEGGVFIFSKKMLQFFCSVLY